MREKVHDTVDASRAGSSPVIYARVRFIFSFDNKYLAATFAFCRFAFRAGQSATRLIGDANHVTCIFENRRGVQKRIEVGTRET